MAGAEPVRDTARRFAFEIAAITAGILIALSIDAVVERQRERALVSQARTAVAREIADNRQASAQDLQVFRSRLLDAIGALAIHRSLAGSLADGYRKLS